MTVRRPQRRQRNLRRKLRSEFVVSGGLAFALAFGSAGSRDARGDDAAILPATMTCEPGRAPGRVVCSVASRAAPGESIVWGDVILIGTPPFVTALRGRIGPHEATQRDPAGWRWDLALVARRAGHGAVEARVRLVVCRADACEPRQLPVTGLVDVGE